MNRNNVYITVLILFLFSFQACHRSTDRLESEQLIVKVNTKNPGRTISDESVGLSYETKQLLPDENGEYYFRPDNTALLNMFKTLGIKNLRIGGNSVDAAKIKIPDEKDIHSFFKFAKAADVKVIYSVRLQDGDPRNAQNIAKIIYDNYKEVLESFAIGNEPGYYKDYDVYISRWTAIRDAILEVYPDAVFSGPDQNPDAERLKKIVADFGYPNGRLVQVAQHNYPFGCSYENYKEHDVTKLIPFEAEQSREKMLTDSACHIYEDILKGMLEAVEGTPLSYRLTETNSYWYSGLEGVSDSYASALWGLDYLHWWTSHGAAGLNFHTGDITGGEISLPCRYAVFVSSENNYEARPLAYALKLFSMGGSGQSLSVEVPSSSVLNLVAYANLNQKNELLITLINKEFKSTEDKGICIQLDNSILQSTVEIISLQANNNDIAVGSSDITLGGAQISNEGIWNGKWQVLPDNKITDGEINVTVPPACAIVLKANIH